MHGVWLLGVYLQLNGMNLSNNSLVHITEIGTGDDESVLCITNNSYCCRWGDTSNGQPKGQWYFPNNGSAVGTDGERGDFYRNRGPSVVRLHRRNNALMPGGSFCCEIPDANERYHALCLMVTTTLTGTTLLVYFKNLPTSGIGVLYLVKIYAERQLWSSLTITSLFMWPALTKGTIHAL